VLSQWGGGVLVVLGAVGLDQLAESGAEIARLLAHPHFGMKRPDREGVAAGRKGQHPDRVLLVNLVELAPCLSLLG